MSSIRIRALAVSLVIGVASASSAVPITLPTGLTAGEQYRLAFVTSSGRDALSVDIADYNAFVTSVANAVPELAALGTTWTAIGSTLTVDARDNTSTDPTVESGYAIYLLNDTKLVDDYADLWDGSIDVPLDVDETGAAETFPSNQVWTGTATDGTAGGSGLPLGAIDVTYGNSAFAFGIWIDDGSTNSSTFNRQLYAVSGVLTAVPEPGTALLLALGLAIVGGRRRRLI